VIKGIIFKRKEGVGRKEGRARETAVVNFLKMALCIGPSRPSQEPNLVSLQRKISLLFLDEFSEQIIILLWLSIKSCELSRCIWSRRR
jgi:hypothetical protein